VRNTLLAEGIGHARHLHAAHHAAEVEHVLLRDREPAVGYEPTEVVRAGLLLAAGDGNVQRIGYLLGLLIPVKAHRLFKEGVVVFLHQLSNFDGLFHVVRPVGIS
jgi:hypothetical protein